MSDTPAPSGASPAFTAVETGAPAADPSVGVGSVPNDGNDGFDLSAALAKYADQLVKTPASSEAPPPPAAAAPPPAAPSQAPAAAAPPPPQAPEQSEETQLRSRELVILARKQAELDQARAQLPKQVEAAKAQAIEELRAQFTRNPRQFARTVGLKPDQLSTIGTLYLGEALGDEAPDDVKQKLQMYELQSELEAIKQDRTAQREEAKEAVPAHVIARANATEAEIEAFVADVPAELPFLALEAKENPREAMEALCQIAIPLANEAYLRGGRWPTAREVARLLNDELARNYERLSRAAGKPATPASTQAPAPSAQAPTLSDADLTARPDRQPEGLLSDDEYVNRAIGRYSSQLVR